MPLHAAQPTFGSPKRRKEGRLFRRLRRFCLSSSLGRVNERVALSDSCMVDKEGERDVEGQACSRSGSDTMPRKQTNKKHLRPSHNANVDPSGAHLIHARDCTHMLIQYLLSSSRTAVEFIQAVNYHHCHIQQQEVWRQQQATDSASSW